MNRLLILALIAFPAVASAQDLGNLQELLDAVGSLVERALPIVVGIALLGFFWGLAKFIFSAGDEGAKDEGKRIMIWGVVALFVMVSVWGLVNFLADTFDINRDDSGEVPTVEGL